MEDTMIDTRQHVHRLVDELGAEELGAVERLLVALQDDELTEEDRRAIEVSREYFRQGGLGIPFEQVVAECGFTMDEIHNYKGE